MSETPQELHYASTHEWVRQDGDGMVSVGITDFAQDELGDVVFVDLPEVGMEVSVGQEVCVVESVKTASDLYAPVSGVIAEVNGALLDKPELINESPYAEGWLFRIKMAAESELEALLSAEDYESSRE